MPAARLGQAIQSPTFLTRIEGHVCAALFDGGMALANYGIAEPSEKPVIAAAQMASKVVSIAFAIPTLVAATVLRTHLKTTNPGVLPKLKFGR